MDTVVLNAEYVIKVINPPFVEISRCIREIFLRLPGLLVSLINFGTILWLSR
jgi:hypothetical protein